MATTASAGQAKARSYRFPTGVAGDQILGPPSQGGLEVEKLGHKLVLIWDAVVAKA